MITSGPKYDALDILAPDSNAFGGMKFTRTNQVMNWVNFFIVGVLTGVVAFAIDMLTTILTHWRQTTPQHIMNKDLNNPLYDHQVQSGTYAAAWITYSVFCTVYVVIAVVLSLYFGPGAIASGVAETLAYVNGVNFPNFISWPTLITKCIGVSLAVAGDIKVGKEGPLAHIGSVLAIITLYFPLGSCNRAFRNDRDK